jgi:NAD(P)-dependent dehydrogenase (short-subunit alcohol dehydrogenase family)
LNIAIDGFHSTILGNRTGIALQKKAMGENKVWYITGTSKGLGAALVKQLLEKGQRVVATTRNVSAFSGLTAYDKSLLPVETDLASDQSVAASLQQAIDRFGKVDVVVNNAGYGLGGALEELSPQEIADNFEINFFAVARVIRHALPHLRKQRSGFILNISSIAGFAPGTGWTLYSAAKSAVIGLSQALANELRPLGIHVVNIIPGGFRTSFAKPDSIAFGQQHIADYSYLRTYHANMQKSDGLQQGNPDKVADAFLQLVNSETPASDLFLGTDAFNRASARLLLLNETMEKWKQQSTSTDFK